jgi:uncharacterized membrane protein (UPF0127 family)
MRLKIGDNIFNVKVVTSKFDKAQGMMNRRFTDEFNGMLFLMDDDENCFWMKNCIIPLDIIFIEGNTISKIHHNCQPCKADDCKNYCGEGRLVLEIEGGSARELEIKKGAEVKLLL